ncbi:MAG: hypothetical protein JOZ29_21600 [Deltaproteobacteria bacterium]|nr:hypothetical protein [Deltaproteobacteria bacterium]
MGNSNQAAINGSTTKANGFKAFGKTYANEREAILEFLDKYGAAEAAAEVCLNKWVDLAKNDCVRGGVQMIAEREGYHGRIFARRLRELGGQRKDDGSETSRALAYASDPNLSDAEKLLKATAFGPDPKALLQPIFDFGDAIRQDQLTKQMVQLYAKDELGSATWVYETCAMLNGKGAAVQARA